MGVDAICYVYILELHITIAQNGHGTHSCVKYNRFHFIKLHLNKSQSQQKSTPCERALKEGILIVLKLFREALLGRSQNWQSNILLLRLKI